MADLQPLVQTSPHHITYINSIFSTFMSGVGDYLRTDLFPRAKDTVISTHTKAAEMVRTRKNLAKENWSPKFPFLVIQPSMDIRPDPVVGKLLHHYPNFMARFASKLNNPRLYEDDNVIIAPVLNRFVGTIDIILWCSSVYEAIDERMAIIQMFGGENSIIHPRNFECLLIIPDFLENYTYENKYTEESYTLDWSGNSPKSSYNLIRNINQNKLCFPVTIRPYLRLVSIDDSTEPFGGSGNTLSDHRVGLTIEWEASIPTHLVMVEKKQPLPSVPITIEISHNFKYIENPLDLEEVIYVPDERFINAIVDTSSGEVEHKTLKYRSAENYIITEDDITKFENSENLYIDPIDYIPQDSRYLKIHGKYGYLIEPIHYDVKNNQIVLYGQNLKLMTEGDIITFLYYEDLTFDGL